MMAVYGPNEPDSRVLEGAAAELRKKRARTALCPRSPWKAPRSFGTCRTKRIDPIRHPEQHGCEFLRQGSNHTASVEYAEE